MAEILDEFEVKNFDKIVREKFESFLEASSWNDKNQILSKISPYLECAVN